MAIYSHSQLSTYEECPLKYKLCYRDGIKRDTEGIEAFLGSMVHETLRKCYDEVRLTRLNTLDELLTCYDSLWQKSWHDGIVITKKDLKAEHYRALGRKMIATYYKRHAPFDRDITIGTEMRLGFSLDDGGKYQFQGYIDRLSRTPDGVHLINDYKTSAHLPGQDEIDSDRQLALYQIGIQKKWPDIKEVRLVWHYLAFDRELVSTRSAEKLTELAGETIKLIDEIESAEDFPPRESNLCDWCEYPDLCPNRKHLYTVEALPANQFLNEPGVVLVNKYAELKEKAGEIDEEMALVKEALVEYARREGVTVIRGSDRKVRVKFDEKLKFPGKNEPGRRELDEAVVKAGKWPEVSQLDISVLTRAIEDKLWDKEMIDEVMKYGRIEESSAVYLSKLKELEE
ncbi:MAG: PD-(D/E)XK nuclease family protein [Chloroflexota bacterium]